MTVRLLGRQGPGVRLQAPLSNGNRLWQTGDPSGLPRNGLVALYDPYRDVYGRNVSVATTAGISKAGMTESSGTFLETATTATHIIQVCGSISVAPHWESYKFTPVGRKRFMVGGAPGVVVDTETVSIVHSGADASGASIVANGDGSFTARVYRTAPYTPIFYTMPDDAADYNARSFAGDTSKGFTLHQWQVNLGSQLFPYSTPAGAPGTLQTSLDYSGHGNHLTLGATTGASTDDPAFTGTAWSFDGGDYLKGPNALKLTSQVTALGVVAPTNYTDKQRILSCTEAGGFLLGINELSNSDNVMAILRRNGDYGRVTYAGLSSLTGTQCLGMSYDGRYLKGYVGGVLVGTNDAGGDYPIQQSVEYVPILFGTETPAGWGAYLTGKLYFVAMWNRALTLQEQVRTYNYIKGLMAKRGVTVA